MEFFTTRYDMEIALENDINEFKILQNLIDDQTSRDHGC